MHLMGKRNIDCEFHDSYPTRALGEEQTLLKTDNLKKMFFSTSAHLKEKMNS